MAEETLEERQARWWRDWFAADYSWDGLAGKDILGGGQFGEVTLQDYWRRDPATDSFRTDAALKRLGELVEFDGCWWHLAHLPPRGKDGAESWKADLTAPSWVSLQGAIGARLAAATELPGAIGFDGGDWSGVWRWQPEGLDGRALLDGAVLGPCLIGPEGGTSVISLSCRSTAFLGDNDFGGAVFGPGADFDKATFSADASFDRVTFSGDANFDEVVFSGNANFHRARFSRYISFSKSKLAGSSVFESAMFLGGANFYGAIFSESANFIFSIFSSSVIFNCSRLSNASFFTATFSGEAEFHGSVFSGGASLNCATFSGDASFQGAVFSDVVNFNSATFSGGASFRGATFSRYTSFSGAAFSGIGGFYKATFVGDANFDSATFKSSALFSGAFQGKTSFHDAVFEGPIAFSAAIAAPERDFTRAFYGARFAGIADFSGAVGEGQGGRMAAAFAEAQVEKALILTDGLDSREGQIFYKILLGNTRAAIKGVKACNEAFATLESGCRVVKIAMGKARDEVREQAYYRLQLRARQQRSDIDRWEKILGWIYGIASDFGSSLWRPLVGLAVLVLVFAVVIYWPWMAWLNIKDAHGPGGVFVALNQSLRTLSPFNLLTGPGMAAAGGSPASLFEVNPAVTFGVRMVSGLQSILSTLLIFLFGLAVKRRFQIS